MEEFIMTNWLPILIFIPMAIGDPMLGASFGIGMMLFGTDNKIWLWICLILSLLSIGSKTYKKSSNKDKKEETKDPSNWEM